MRRCPVSLDSVSRVYLAVHVPLDSLIAISQRATNLETYLQLAKNVSIQFLRMGQFLT